MCILYSSSGSISLTILLSALPTEPSEPAIVIADSMSLPLCVLLTLGVLIEDCFDLTREEMSTSAFYPADVENFGLVLLTVSLSSSASSYTGVLGM